MQNNNRNGINAEYSRISGRSAYPAQRAQGQTVSRSQPRPGTPTRNSRQSLNQSGAYRTQRVEPISSAPRGAQKSPVRKTSRRSQPRRRAGKRSFLKDFLLGFAVGLAVFGTAAVFVIRAILELII